MDCDDPKERFIQGSFLLEPFYLFESVQDPQALARSFVEKCERLAGGERERFYRWLGGILEDSCTFCFYGSALTIQEPDDADMLSLTLNPGQLFIQKPSFIHVLEAQKAGGDLAKNWGPFFLGNLLFPRAPPGFILNIIDCCRQAAFSSPFFGGGYGELLTYAAFKSIGCEELFETDEWHVVKSLKKPRIEYRRLDLANMQMVPYSMNEVNCQIRKELCALEEKEMRALAMAAARRIGVKSEHRAAVTGTFLGELKKMKR
jgi:hypothetical protein